MSRSLHAENSLYNALLAKSRSKPKRKGVLRIMRPKVVLKKLEDLGIHVTGRTLQNYVTDKLIPAPDTKGAGQGLGKDTEYRDETVAEFYAAYYRKHNKNLKLKADKIAEIRAAALAKEKDPEALKATGNPFEKLPDGMIRMSPHYARFQDVGGINGMGNIFIMEWLTKRSEAEAGAVPPGKMLQTAYDIYENGEITRTLEIIDSFTSSGEGCLSIRVHREVED